MIYYPLSTGRKHGRDRSPDRCAANRRRAQRCDSGQLAPGDKVLIGAPRTTEQAEERVGEKGLECIDWYLCKKSL